MEALQGILRDETADGWTEISCHPGYRWPGFSSVYHAEREAELATLTDPAIRRTLDECGLRLASYGDWVAVVGSRTCA